MERDSDPFANLTKEERAERLQKIEEREIRRKAVFGELTKEEIAVRRTRDELALWALEVEEDQELVDMGLLTREEVRALQQERQQESQNN